MRTLVPKEHKKTCGEHLPGIGEKEFQTCLFDGHEPYSTKLVI